MDEVKLRKKEKYWILGGIIIVGFAAILALNMKYHFIGFTRGLGTNNQTEMKHVSYENAETWSWKDYKGRLREMTVHREMTQ